MRPTAFQHAELRDEDDQIVQQGTYGKGSALSNSTNDAWIDYVMNNLEALFNNSVSTDSPAFTGIPTAPTAASGDDSTQIATTAFVQGELGGLAPLNSPALTGTPTAPTPTAGDDSTQIATTSYVQAELDDYLALTGGSITGNVDITGDLDVTGAVSGSSLSITGAISGDSVTSNNVDVKSGSIAPVNTLQRSTAYSVDDIVYTSALNAKYYLLCVTAGTTSSVLPSLTNIAGGDVITDGTAEWEVQTITSEEKVDSGFFAKLVTNLAASTAATISSLNTNSLFYRMLSWALTASGVQYNFNNSNAWYICLGALFGGLIIQGGSASVTANSTTSGKYYGDKNVSYPISFSSTPVVQTACTANPTFWGSNPRSASASSFILEMGGGTDIQTLSNFWIAVGF